MANTTGRIAPGETLRAANEAMVIEAIRAQPTSRAELGRRLGLSRPTVSAIVDDLVTRGVVREGTPRAGRAAARRRSGPGRPPVLLSFDARSTFVIGIHIGVRETTVELADATGQEGARRRGPTPTVPAEQALRDIGALARELAVVAAIPRR